ncbi:histone H2b [Purpureocillium lavendulum]|uniref:Histone H2b n=1 Tax=Purpureocillium lavendulum TaxID=1247861 RepID=A0AB34FFF8_9HYPO|nr:histone H2b [Purpureocillium lavendulum]
MVALLPVAGLLALAASSAAVSVNDITWYNHPNDPSGTCTEDQRRIIVEEFGVARDAADTAHTNWRLDSAYARALFPSSLTDNEEFYYTIRDRLSRLTEMLEGRGNSDFGAKGQVRVLCAAKAPGCEHNGVIATMTDPGWWLNFCPGFFNDMQPTKDLLNVCRNQVPGLETAGRGRAMAIVHELTHTSYIGHPRPRTQDYAYGLVDSMRLAANSFDRSCAVGYPPTPKPLCPKEGDAQKEGPCKEEESEYNADTYKYLVAGYFFENKCGQPIRFPPLQKRSSIDVDVDVDVRRDTSCPTPSNPEIIDQGPLPGKINGYVRFGDSYASGLGAGTTSGDGCRVGSNNYGNLLVQHFNQDGLDYQQLSCSGDTLDGLAGQVDRWSNQDKATLGTLTIGGNDVGFSDLVANCVITPFTWRGGSATRAACLDVQAKARGYMHDSSDNGLRAKLKNAYLKVMDKALVPGFQLYVTGYPTFFNADTDTCDYSSFHLWWGGYNPSSDWPSYRTTFLTKGLRAELNDLVAQLNGVILGAIQDANAALGADQVHFVDVVGAFEGHRWCEGGTKEPDQGNANTYFLLSNWADSAGSSASKMKARRSLEAAAASAGPHSRRDYASQLPDGATCADNLGANPDPAAVQACWLAQGIAKDPNGPAAHLLGASTGYGNYSHNTLTVSWFSPTWLIETFHPRTSGMKAYRDAILRAMQQTGFSV